VSHSGKLDRIGLAESQRDWIGTGLDWIGGYGGRRGRIVGCVSWIVATRTRQHNAKSWAWPHCSE
jgi:hypothetical protein